MELQDIVSGMLADVASGKALTPRKKKKNILTDKTYGRQADAHEVTNPWTAEALVLITTVCTCQRCGNEATSWEPNLYIERINRRPRNPIRQIERLDSCVYSAAYGGLPKRIEVRHKQSDTCPLCFGIGDSNGDALIPSISPKQLELLK